MKKILSIVLFCTISTQVHAGIWDSITGFFGGEDKEVVAPQAEANTKVEQAVSESPSLLKTGMQLLPLLTQTLGVSDGQAKGGIGAILQAVQAMLPKNDYSSLLDAIPGAKGLLAAAPALTKNNEEADVKNKLLSSAMDMAGKDGETLKQGANLISQFKSLGMGAEMIPKFANVASGFLEKTDKPEAGNLLSSALSQIKGLGI